MDQYYTVKVNFFLEVNFIMRWMNHFSPPIICVYVGEY